MDQVDPETFVPTGCVTWSAWCIVTSVTARQKPLDVRAVAVLMTGHDLKPQSHDAKLPVLSLISHDHDGAISKAFQLSVVPDPTSFACGIKL